MAKSATTTVQYGLSGDNFSTSTTGPMYANTNTNAAGSVPGSITCATGFNAITAPATCLGVTIVPPPGNAVTLTLKGVTGDTGILLSPTQPTVLSFTSGSVPAF